MDAKDRGEPTANKNSICSLEWIALAMEAARRHKETVGVAPELDEGLDSTEEE